MKDAAHTLLGEVEREAAALPGASLLPGGGADAARRFATLAGAPPPPGLAAFLAAHDGAVLAPDVRLLTLDEAAARRFVPERAALPTTWPPELWPILERSGRRFALDAADADSDGEWPVVEVSDRGIDRVGTSFLRFLHVVCAELRAGDTSGGAAVALGEERCRRDPGHADHWLDLAELLEQAGRQNGIDATLTAALRASTPPTPALLLAIGMRAARAGAWEAAWRAFSDAMSLEPIGARDDDARLDAAAVIYVLAS